MKIPFTKLHGAKNDFLVTSADVPIDDMPITDLQELAMAICNRYTGVGADGWILLDRIPGPEYDATIRIFNSDGSEPELSGNGTRCVALLLAKHSSASSAKPAGKGPIRIRTRAGIKSLRALSDGLFEMNMGEIRVLELHARVQGHDAVILDVGNPQCAIPVDDFDFDWRSTGRRSNGTHDSPTAQMFRSSGRSILILSTSASGKGARAKPTAPGQGRPARPWRRLRADSQGVRLQYLRPPAHWY
jgi:diaminopimelate epimerase